MVYYRHFQWWWLPSKVRCHLRFLGSAIALFTGGRAAWPPGERQRMWAGRGHGGERTGGSGREGRRRRRWWSPENEVRAASSPAAETGLTAGGWPHRRCLPAAALAKTAAKAAAAVQAKKAVGVVAVRQEGRAARECRQSGRDRWRACASPRGRWSAWGCSSWRAAGWRSCSACARTASARTGSRSC